MLNTGSDVHAAPHVEVIALFENKAMLHIDNDRVLVSVGETTKHGVKLISANAHDAVIEINGENRIYQLGNVVRNTTTDEQKTEPEILVYQGADTMFRTIGSMNGYPVNFLVDTGASSIAMSSVQAKRLGINYKLKGESTWVATASGVEKAVKVTIDKVTISGITIRSVEGLVIEGSEPSTPLLGMSYLNRFKIINDGNLMRLKRKY
ncbi:MAG: TIGR02281 family clan AA aspartic protease [Gammaproteobacteria bacterium]